jgi:hypothetical protein
MCNSPTGLHCIECSRKDNHFLCITHRSPAGEYKADQISRFNQYLSPLDACQGATEEEEEKQ